MIKRTLLTILALCSLSLSAATNTWTGSVDSNWSTAGNWSTASVPGTSDDVIINGSVNLTVDQNVDVKSIIINPAYTGTVNGGNKTITLNTGTFSDTGGNFSASTSTLKFTGAADQVIYYKVDSTLYNCANYH